MDYNITAKYFYIVLVLEDNQNNTSRWKEHFYNFHGMNWTANFWIVSWCFTIFLMKPSVFINLAYIKYYLLLLSKYQKRVSNH